MANKFTVPVLFGETEELSTITVSAEEYERIMNGDQEILQNLFVKETEKRNTATIQHLVNSNNQDLASSETVLLSKDDAKENYKDCKNNEEKETFTWPEKAVLLFLDLYREREQEFTTGLKRHNKIWNEIACELQNSNYNVSAVQVQNKMSSLKRTFKKIKDSNAKSGNHNTCWAYYSAMNAIFGEKGWVSPPAVASSDGPIVPSASPSSSLSTCRSASLDTLEYQDSPSKPKKRKVEAILDSFISDIQRNRDEMKEERREQRMEKEKRKEERWEIARAEKKEMHKETAEIQRSLVSLLGQLVEKQNESK